ncbi:MAG: hypothetical protein ACXVCP_20205, partial [Bdellovibrio sp.]
MKTGGSHFCNWVAPVSCNFPPKIKFEIDRDLKRYPLLVTVLLGYRHLLVFRKLRFNAHDQDKNHSDL